MESSYYRRHSSKRIFYQKDGNYTYDASDLKNIKVFSDKGKQLSEKERKELQLGFSPVWVNGEQKFKELLNDPKIIQAFEDKQGAVFYNGALTENYKDVLKIDAKNSFLWIDDSDDRFWIHLNPHAWVDTNPSYRQFKDTVKK